MLAAVRERQIDLEQLALALAHDSYHLGQIMYVRAMQGIEQPK